MEKMECIEYRFRRIFEIDKYKYANKEFTRKEFVEFILKDFLKSEDVLKMLLNSIELTQYENKNSETLTIRADMRLYEPAVKVDNIPTLLLVSK